MKKTTLCIILVLSLIFISSKIGAITFDLSPSEILISEIFQTPEKGFYIEPKVFEIPYDDSKLPKKIKENNINISVYYINDDKLIRMSNTILNKKKNIASFETYFSGSFCVLARTKPYGITEEGEYKEGKNPVLLIHGPLLSHQTWNGLKEELLNTLPDIIIFTFEYPVSQDIEKSAKLLSNELKRMHKKYGEFELDVITHSYGCIVLLGYIGNDHLFHKDIEKGLGIVPPLNGSNLVILENIQELVKFGSENNLIVSDVAKSLTFFVTLDNKSQILEPHNEKLKNLLESFKNYNLPRQYGKESKKANISEVIRGNRPFFELPLLENNEPDFKITELFELQDGIGDGLMDSNINRDKIRRISWLSMEPYPYNHLEIVNKNDIIKKAVDYLSLPRIYAVRFLETITLDDLYKESSSEINIHKWRNIYTPIIYEMARKLISSTDKNAILFTNGDMDTFYPWDLQNKENYREDVAIVNLSLLNTPWFIKLIRDEKGVIFNLTDEEIDNLQPEKLKEEKQFRINDNIVINFKSGKNLYIKDKAVLQIIKDNFGKRPIYFAITVADHVGFDNYLQSEGMADRLVETKGKNQIDPVRLNYYLENVFTYNECFDENGNIIGDKQARRLINNYGAVFMRMSTTFYQNGDYENAVGYLKKAMDFVHEKDRYLPSLANLYYEMGLYDSALSVIEPLVKRNPEDPQLIYLEVEFLVKKGDIEKALSLLEKYIINNPEEEYFVTSYLSICKDNKKYKQGFDLIDNLLQQNPEKKTYLQYKSELEILMLKNSEE